MADWEEWRPHWHSSSSTYPGSYNDHSDYVQGWSGSTGWNSRDQRGNGQGSDDWHDTWDGRWWHDGWHNDRQSDWHDEWRDQGRGKGRKDGGVQREVPAVGHSRAKNMSKEQDGSRDRGTDRGADERGCDYNGRRVEMNGSRGEKSRGEEKGKGQEARRVRALNLDPVLAILRGPGKGKGPRKDKDGLGTGKGAVGSAGKDTVEDTGLAMAPVGHSADLGQGKEKGEGEPGEETGSAIATTTGPSAGLGQGKGKDEGKPAEEIGLALATTTAPSPGLGQGKGKGKGKPAEETGLALATTTGHSSGPGPGKGKGKGKPPKKTPEERGFKLSDGGIYIRAAQLRTALPVKPRIEIGNLEKVPHLQLEPLPRGSADVEVLCNRQTILGNPFNMASKDRRGPVQDRPKGPRPKDESLRDPVCDAFDHFLEAVMRPEAGGALEPLAVQSASSVGLPRGVVGSDWVRDFGDRQVEEFRAALLAVEELLGERRGAAGQRGVRLLCHCVPARCHCMALAARLG